MRHAIGATVLIIVYTACAVAQSGRAPQSPPWLPAPSLRGASATVSSSRLRIAFPRIPLDSLGCGWLDTLPGEAPSRRYYFLVSNEFPSSRYPDNHFMITGVNAYVPQNMTITPARLDSLLRASELTVEEAAGEPPMYVRGTTSTFAVAHYDGVRVVMEVAGESAVRAFLAAGVDSVSLRWCERGELLSTVAVPLRRAQD